MNPETIFVQTDPLFNLPLYSLAELAYQGRLQTTFVQRVFLRNIESNHPIDDRRLMFGGDLAANTKPEAAFGQTASAVVRMCMLEAVNIPRALWPKRKQKSQTRNEGKLNKEILHPLPPPVNPFRLAINKKQAMHYWSKYDQLYPHFRIQHEVSQVAFNAQASIPGMMLIFRENFTEVIEISTTFTARQRRGKVFHSYVHVACIVRRIIDRGEIDGKFTQDLKFLLQPQEVRNERFKNMMEEFKKKIGFEPLSDGLSDLEIDEEVEQDENAEFYQ